MAAYVLVVSPPDKHDDVRYASGHCKALLQGGLPYWPRDDEENWDSRAGTWSGSGRLRIRPVRVCGLTGGILLSAAAASLEFVRQAVTARVVEVLHDWWFSRVFI